MEPKKIETSGEWLKMAIKDAFGLMDNAGSDGFDYRIGNVRDLDIRIVAEPKEGSCEIVKLSGGLIYTAVWEKEQR